MWARIPTFSTRSIGRKRFATPCGWPLTTSRGQGSIEFPMARCSGSISTSAFTRTWAASSQFVVYATGAPPRMTSVRDTAAWSRIEGGEVYPDRNAVTEALIAIVNAELMALVAASVDFVQLDESSFACHPDAPDHILDVVARTVRGVRAYISMHMCFGNYRGRAVGHRSYRPLFPHIGRVAVNQLALEFASRELAEVQLLAELPETMDVAVGLVDVKNTWIEPAELVASRIKAVLKHVSPERLSVTPDCGFSQTARHIAVAKSEALVKGVRIVRRKLEG